MRRPNILGAGRLRTDGASSISFSFALFLALTVGLVLLAGCPRTAEENVPEAWITIGSQRVASELANTPEKQSKGLGYRDSLDWGDGMYFPYDRAGIYRFWMRGMRFSIDIVWIRSGHIVDISRDVPFVPGENGPTVQSREAVDSVLEVPAGFAIASGWRIGDVVTVEATGERKSDSSR